MVCVLCVEIDVCVVHKCDGCVIWVRLLCEKSVGVNKRWRGGGGGGGSIPDKWLTGERQ